MAVQTFHAVPDGEPSLREAYEVWAQARTPLGTAAPEAHPGVEPATLSVGIVGGGMSGLYAALLLRYLGASVQVFEADPARLGGRVYTHRFDPAPNQYFEAGAMRLPEIPEQQPVFDLIGYLNAVVGAQDRIETMPYVLYDDAGDLVYVNSRPGPDGKAMSVAYANAHPDALGFTPEATGGRTASAWIDDVIGPLLALLQKDFDRGFAEIVKYDDFSFRSYLAQVAGWSEDRINYVEVMTSQTNQFQNSFTELVIENMDFSQASWKTIRNGMDRLPNALASVIGRERITMGARVTRVREVAGGGVSVSVEGDPEDVRQGADGAATGGAAHDRDPAVGSGQVPRDPSPPLRAAVQDRPPVPHPVLGASTGSRTRRPVHHRPPEPVVRVPVVRDRRRRRSRRATPCSSRGSSVICSTSPGSPTGASTSPVST